MGIPTDDASIDTFARRLASGLSRRDALRSGAVVFAGALAMSPSDAWAAATGKCPKHRVKCSGKCCPAGEVCLAPTHKGAMHRCGCPAHTPTRCGTKCINTKTDAHNCGACGHACGTNQICSAGTCVTRCSAGETNCSGACVTLATDPKNCGTCGHACATNQLCSAGTCVTECSVGETNCSGACVTLATDAKNCGACGHTCPSDQVCAGGQCGCAAGQTMCNGACVTLASDHDNCGKCGNPCGSGEVCSGGACVSNCATGETDCSGSCKDTSSDVNNCGACGQICDTVNSLGAGCVGGVCQYTGCAHGYADCDTTGSNTNGCETNIDTDATNCGACGARCDTNRSLGATCVAGFCQYTGCKPGFADCTQIGSNTDGCETDIDNDAKNCGACGQLCNTANANVAVCAGGVCHYACKAGYSNCNTSGANTGGCACQTPGCCNTSCQTTHANGLGPHFYDCNALNTHTSASAFEACAAQTGTSALCSDGWTCGSSPPSTFVCATTTPSGPTCADYCWGYSGPAAGTVSNCSCTQVSAWN
jgi:hypothetical protein